MIADPILTKQNCRYDKVHVCVAHFILYKYVIKSYK